MCVTLFLEILIRFHRRFLKFGSSAPHSYQTRDGDHGTEETTWYESSYPQRPVIVDFTAFCFRHSICTPLYSVLRRSVYLAANTMAIPSVTAFIIPYLRDLDSERARESIYCVLTGYIATYLATLTECF